MGFYCCSCVPAPQQSWTGFCVLSGVCPGLDFVFCQVFVLDWILCFVRCLSWTGFGVLSGVCPGLDFVFCQVFVPDWILCFVRCLSWTGFCVLSGVCPGLDFVFCHVFVLDWILRLARCCCFWLDFMSCQVFFLDTQTEPSKLNEMLVSKMCYTGEGRCRSLNFLAFLNVSEACSCISCICLYSYDESHLFCKYLVSMSLCLW